MESNFNALSYASGIDHNPYFAIAARVRNIKKNLEFMENINIRECNCKQIIFFIIDALCLIP